MVKIGHDLLYYVNKVESGCWEWTGHRNRRNYGRYRQRQAHRVSYERFKGPIPPGMFVCHHCDNPPCINPEHLFLGTCADNMADMAAKGRGYKWNGARRGEANPKAKLNDQAVREILQLRGVATYREIAGRFGVGETTVSNILAGRSWVHVSND